MSHNGAMRKDTGILAWSTKRLQSAGSRLMKVATFNVNSLRKRLPVVKRWLKNHAPDVLCLQETKVQDSEFPAQAFAATGYHVRFCGMKGYNGVALFTRREPEWVSYGFEQGLRRGRAASACTPWWTAFPSSTRISRRASGSTIPSIATNWIGSNGCAGILSGICLPISPRSGAGT